MAGQEEEEEEDARELWEARFPEEVTQPDAVKGIGSAGQLARVHVVNFMCHENFEAKFKCTRRTLSPASRPPHSAFCMCQSGMSSGDS